jgi:hypothetical protein
MIIDLGDLSVPGEDPQCTINTSCHVDVRKIKLPEAARVFYQQQRVKKAPLHVGPSNGHHNGDGLHHVVNKREDSWEIKQVSVCIL